MKKLISVMVALAMVLSLSVTAFAADSTYVVAGSSNLGGRSLVNARTESKVIAEVSRTFEDVSWANSDGVILCPSADGTLTVEVSSFASVETPEGYVVDVYNLSTYDWAGEHYATEGGTVSYPVSAGVNYVVFVYPAAVNGGYLNYPTGGSVEYMVTSDVECEIVVEEEPVPGEDENNPIVFNTESYSATVPAYGIVWFAFDDMEDMWFNGIYEQQFVITGTPGFGVTYGVDSSVAADGSVSDIFAGNYMGQYVFAITNNTDSEQTYAITFSNVDSDEEDGETGGEAGGETDDETVSGDGNIGIVDQAVGANQPWIYTFSIDTPGVLNIKIGECSPGWRYKIISPVEESIYQTKWGVGADAEFELAVLGEYTIKLYAYSSADADNVDGTVSCDITFTPEDIGQDVEKDAYSISGSVLGEGENNLTMDENAENTLFEFEPETTGTYVFTAPEGVLIGDWNTSTYPYDRTGADKSNVVEWVCTSVGQSILIGVAGSEDIVLDVTKKGEYNPNAGVEWVDYENTATLEDYILSEDAELVQIDVTDDVREIAVLGEDGYYHLNTVEGPILLVDLNEYLIGATGNGNVGHIVKDENGNVVSKVLYNNAISEYYNYSDGGVYPLTADLMEFYKNFGAAQGWYDEDVLGFYLFGDVEVDPESAWMFCCYYDASGNPVIPEVPVAPENPETPETPETPDENPETGDYSVAGLVIAMMAATAGAVVISKKKEL